MSLRNVYINGGRKKSTPQIFCSYYLLYCVRAYGKNVQIFCDKSARDSLDFSLENLKTHIVILHFQSCGIDT